MSFHVGQKVVCVDTWPHQSLWERIVDAWDEFRHPYDSPVKGSIYTIELMYIAPNGLLALALVELPNKDPFWGDGFWACGFRPVVERKTDISVFTAMLNRQKVPA